MSKRPVSIELPEEVWEIIDNNFKLNGETDFEILSNIIKNHLAQNGYYLDADSLIHGNGLKERISWHSTGYEHIYSRAVKKKGIDNSSGMGSNNARKVNKKC